MHACSLEYISSIKEVVYDNFEGLFPFFSVCWSFSLKLASEAKVALPKITIHGK